MSDPMEFGKQIGALIREALTPLERQVKALQAVELKQGEPGKDADPAVVAAMVKEAVEALPTARGGKDADPADLEALADLVVDKMLASQRLLTLVDLATADAVSKHFEANPVQHGRDADPAVIDLAVKAAVDALPAPKNGRDADPVTDEQLAAQVAKHLSANPPQAGADGVGLAGAMIDRGGELVITTTKGEAVKLGKVVGEDGQDGISFETATGEYEVERGFVIKLGAGQRRTELVLPYMVHRGFYREGMGMKAGQSITHDGALWIAKRDNASKPCLENEQDWALAARKGRDGKDGKSVRVPAEPVKLGAGNA